jgi:hypothetical protein
MFSRALFTCPSSNSIVHVVDKSMNIVGFVEAFNGSDESFKGNKADLCVIHFAQVQLTWVVLCIDVYGKVEYLSNWEF